MRDSVKKFIEDHIDLIESAKFGLMYDEARGEIPFQIGNLSWNLIQAGIDTLEGLTAIPPDAFSNSMLEEFEIPSNIKIIASNAFTDCFQLKKITLPASLKAISISAFKGCYELKTIEYKGTVDQFMTIKIAPNGVFLDCDTERIICSNGNIRITRDGNYRPEGDPIII